MKNLPVVSKEDVVRLWFHRQGMTAPREAGITKKAFVAHLENTGGLQLDSVNVLDRAHWLTLWSRFGAFDRSRVDRWTYRDRAAFEHWGHEACVLPASRLPLSLRGMRLFQPEASWWARRLPSPQSMRRVLRRLRNEGPLESADFEKDPSGSGPWWGWKEDKVSLELLWHAGKAAIHARRHFRRVYALAEDVYPKTRHASAAQYEDSWLLAALAGNGIAPERHLANYWTAPRLKAARRRAVLERNLARRRVVPVAVEGARGAWYALPEHLDLLGRLPEPRGTTLVCPFDSLLWQRERAEDLLGFRYRIEIYTPPEKRVFGYYVMPVLHEGRLTGRLDPKLHRDRGVLEIRAIHLEPGFRRHRAFDAALEETLADLARFVGARSIEMPGGWKPGRRRKT